MNEENIAKHKPYSARTEVGSYCIEGVYTYSYVAIHTLFFTLFLEILRFIK